MKQKRGYYFIYLFLTVASILLDQLAKKWAVDVLRGGEPIPIIRGVLELTYVENRGAAFGMMQGRQGFFLVLTAIIAAAIIYTLIRMPASRRMIPCTACLIAVLSGAIGNLIDRMVQGYVVDFIYFMPIDFPVFNVADIFVTCGMGVLMLLILFYYGDDEWGFLT